MADNVFKSGVFITLIPLIFLLSGQTLQAANLGIPGLAKSENKVPEETVQIPETLDSDQINSFLATLSDAQVRRLFIQELKKEATRELTEGKTDEEAGGLAGLIQKIRYFSDFFHWRIYELKSGAGADPEDLPKFYRLLGKREDQEKPDPFKTIASVIGLFLISYGVVWFSRRSAAAIYRRIENATAVNMKAKIGGLALQALLDLRDRHPGTIFYFYGWHRSATCAGCNLFGRFFNYHGGPTGFAIFPDP